MGFGSLLSFLSTDLAIDLGTANTCVYAKGRGISRATLERLGVASGTAFFPDLGRKASALIFKYRGGAKARAYPEKAFVTNKGFKPSFWNEDAVLASNPEMVFLTEGDRAPSLGSLVSWRAVVSRVRRAEGEFVCEARVVKDKRRGPGFCYQEVCRGPAGLR